MGGGGGGPNKDYSILGSPTCGNYEFYLPKTGIFMGVGLDLML